MKTSKQKSLPIVQFAENLKEIPIDIIDGLLNVMEDEDGKLLIDAYSSVLKNQFSEISNLLIEKSEKMSSETSREAEELLKITSGVDLTTKVKPIAKNLGSSISKIGLAGIVQMIKKIIKWLIEFIFKKIPKWLNKLIDLIDEILNELFGIGSPKLANALSQKEQNYLSELTHLAILNREERYLFEDGDDDEF